MDVATLVVSITLLLIGVAAIVSGFYVIWVYRQRHSDAPYLTMLVYRDVRVAFVPILTDLIVGYALIRFLFPSDNWPMLPPPIGALTIGVSIAVMRWGVVRDAIQFRRDRRLGA